MTLTLAEPTKIKFQAKGGKGEIIIYGDIGFEITAKDFHDELKGLGDVAEMDVRINSFGGDVFDGLAIYNRLSQHEAKKTVYVDGIAASAASVIAMAGDEIHMAEAAVIMIHDAWAMTMGNAKEIRAMAERLEATSAQMAQIYQRKTGADIMQIREWMAEETEFYGPDAVMNGFATHTFEAERMAAKFDPKRHHFKNKPSAARPERSAKAQSLIAEMRMHLAR